MTVKNSATNMQKMRIINVFIACALLISTASFADAPKSDMQKPSVTTILKFPPYVRWQFDSWNTQRLLADNPDKHLVDAEVASLVASYKRPGIARANVADPVQLQTDVLRYLFPTHRFYLIGWDEQTVEGKKAIGLAMGLYYAFVVGPNDEITRLEDFKEYGDFASKN
ncbi:MAG: hypothetical protein ABI210_01180, partial [Abditibacteriaceae bacterium]